jgi:hypothetical protein
MDGHRRVGSARVGKVARKGGAFGVLSVLVFVVAEWTQWR